MLVRDKVVVITGAARGIGEALARRFHAEGARAVIAADLEWRRRRTSSGGHRGFGMRVDVGCETDIQRLVNETIRRYGQIDLFARMRVCSFRRHRCARQRLAQDARHSSASHVYAARAVLPGMLARGNGYLLGQTVSAAGLLTSLESVIYAVTKHAALGLAEWLSMTYGDSGIKVSALLPARRANRHADAGPE